MDLVSVCIAGFVICELRTHQKTKYLSKTKPDRKVTNGNEATRPTTDSISNYGSSHAIQQTRPARPQPRQHGGSNGVRWGQRSSSSNAESGGAETMEAAAMVHPVGTRYE